MSGVITFGHWVKQRRRETAEHRDRYGDFFEADGSLAGPGYSEAEASVLPESLRLAGVVIKPAVPAG